MTNTIRAVPKGVEFIGDDCYVCHLWPRTEENMHLEHHPDCNIGKELTNVPGQDAPEID